MPATTGTLQDLQAALQALFQSLDKAFWYASTIEGKDMIRGLSESVFDALTQLNTLDITSRTRQYDALKASVDRINQKLDVLKGQIDSLIHEMQVASEVVAAIEKAVAAAGKFFA